MSEARDAAPSARRRWIFGLGAAACAAALGCSSASDHAPQGARSAGPSVLPAPPSGTTAAVAASPQAVTPASLSIDARAAQSPGSPGLPPPLPPGAAEPLPPLPEGAVPDEAEQKMSALLRAEDGPYARFYASLRAVEQKQRQDHVRVLWLGDSHGASDFWSGAVRTVLQKRFGNGGPGFVHLGYGAYRHDGVKIAAEGKWRMRPRGPSTTLVTGDGVFGLGGILFTPEAGGSRAELTVTEAGELGRLRWDLCYRLNAPTDQITVRIGGGEPQVLKAAPDAPRGALRHLTLTSDPGASLSVTPTAGAPELCGVVVEADPETHRGVVLDTLGINGARLATPLAWDEASWADELARRAPSLVILQYGTNESGDFEVKPQAYGRHMAAVLGRVRRVQPDVDCLVLAPTDRRDTPDRTPLVRDALRDAAQANQCAFWDTYQAMGGKGSIDAWSKESPPRAARDGVHLSSRGYREIGFKLGDELLRTFRP